MEKSQNNLPMKFFFYECVCVGEREREKEREGEREREYLPVYDQHQVVSGYTSKPHGGT